MALCLACLQIFPEDVDDHWRLDNNGDQYIQRPYPLGDVLRQSAEAACFICTRVHEESARSIWPWIRAISVLEPPLERQPWYKLSIDYATDSDPDDVTNCLGPRFVVQPYDCEADVCGTTAAAATFTGSDEHMILARQWLTRCLGGHGACVKNQTPTWYPTRLLRISGDIVQLIETSAHHPSKPYATLSHCWGTEWFECLTAENMKAFLDGFSRSTLPPTFRDALLVAERLGIGFVWIDSYCIVQSSESNDPAFTKDKMAEIARMKDVYANAMLNLGATHGSGPKHGFFVHRDPLTTECRHFKWQRKNAKQEALCSIREAYGSRHLSALYSNQNLFKRGWVMQERLLAPRMLYFTNKQLYWECAQTGPASELYAEGMPEHGPNAGSTKAWPPFTLKQHMKDDYEMWDSVLRPYSKLGLTYPAQDRLPAVGAIAAAMAEKSGQMYAAGLFRGDILRSLCWRTLIDPGWSFYRLADAGAPSWSWASVSCGVGYKEVSAVDEPMASVEDVSVQLQDSANPFGAVESGSVTLRGRLISATAEPDTREGPFKRVSLMTDIEGIQDEDCFCYAFTSFKEFDILTQRPLFYLPLFWALDVAARWNRYASSPLQIEDVLALGVADRVSVYKKHRTHGLLLVRQSDGCFKRLHMLSWVSAEVLDRWVAKEEKLITLV